MEGKGPRVERETVIRFDEDGDEAEIWTASEITYRQLLKRGFPPDEDNERSASFRVPKKLIKLPRKPSASRVAAGKALAARSTA